MADFEKDIKKLEQIISKLNAGDLTLEKSIELYESGIKLSKSLEASLDENQKRISIIMDGKEQEFDNQKQDKKVEQMSLIEEK